MNEPRAWPGFERFAPLRSGCPGVPGEPFETAPGTVSKRRLSRIARAFFVLVLVCAACGTHRGDTLSRARESAAEATVTGTVLDAASGEPIAGAKIRGPYDARAVSGRDGRFELRGLRAGDQGEVEASLADGRTVKQKLRPLAPGVLEVVLHVSRR